MVMSSQNDASSEVCHQQTLDISTDSEFGLKQVTEQASHDDEMTQQQSPATKEAAENAMVVSRGASFETRINTMDTANIISNNESNENNDDDENNKQKQQQPILPSQTQTFSSTQPIVTSTNRPTNKVDDELDDSLISRMRDIVGGGGTASGTSIGLPSAPDTIESAPTPLDDPVASGSGQPRWPKSSKALGRHHHNPSSQHHHHHGGRHRSSIAGSADVAQRAGEAGALSDTQQAHSHGHGYGGHHHHHHAHNHHGHNHHHGHRYHSQVHGERDRRKSSAAETSEGNKADGGGSTEMADQTGEVNDQEQQQPTSDSVEASPSHRLHGHNHGHRHHHHHHHHQQHQHEHHPDCRLAAGKQQQHHHHHHQHHHHGHSHRSHKKRMLLESEKTKTTGVDANPGEETNKMDEGQQHQDAKPLQDISTATLNQDKQQHHHHRHVHGRHNRHHHHHHHSHLQGHHHAHQHPRRPSAAAEESAGGATEATQLKDGAEQPKSTRAHHHHHHHHHHAHHGHHHHHGHGHHGHSHLHRHHQSNAQKAKQHRSKLKSSSHSNVAESTSDDIGVNKASHDGLDSSIGKSAKSHRELDLIADLNGKRKPSTTLNNDKPLESGLDKMDISPTISCNKENLGEAMDTTTGPKSVDIVKQPEVAKQAVELSSAQLVLMSSTHHQNGSNNATNAQQQQAQNNVASEPQMQTTTNMAVAAATANQNSLLSGSSSQDNEQQATNKQVSNQTQQQQQQQHQQPQQPNQQQPTRRQTGNRGLLPVRDCQSIEMDASYQQNGLNNGKQQQQTSQMVDSMVPSDRSRGLCWCCCCPCTSIQNKTRSGKMDNKTPDSDPSSSNINNKNSASLPNVPIDEVHAWSESFDKLMRHPEGRRIFQDFLRCEYSEENILFWIACQELKSERDPKVIEAKARDIYEDYISILSAKEVSLDSRVRDIINSNIKSPTSNIFDEAQLQIYTLMHRDSYPRFINSSTYKKLAQTTNNSTNSNTNVNNTTTSSTGSNPNSERNSS